MASEVWSLVLDARRITPSILPPSYFLVDCDDWLAHACKKKGLKSTSIDGIVLDSMVRELHMELNDRGIQPIIFLERVPSKNHKSSKSTAFESDDSQRLQLQQLRKTLKSLSVDIEECESSKRAGSMLEFWKTMGLRAEYSCFIYGSPFLDLWAVKGVSYILFDTLTISEVGNRVQAPVWNRSIVAGALFVTEKQLAELMILVGNKYTAPFGRKGYRSATGSGIPRAFHEHENGDTKDVRGFGGIRMKNKESKADDMVSLAAMRDWILQQGSPFTLKFIGKTIRSPMWETPFASADRAIEFSRTYYENGDLTRHYDLMGDVPAPESQQNLNERISKNDNKKKSEISFAPSSSNAAAAIMAAISGSSSSSGSGTNNNLSFGRSVTVTKKIENLDERIEREQSDRKTMNTRENVKSNNNLKSDEKDMRKDNDTKKNKKENTTEKLLPENVIEKVNRRDKNDNNKVDSRRTIVVNPVSSSSTAPTAVPITVDADKGNQLRNLLGIKFGSSSVPISTFITNSTSVIDSMPVAAMKTTSKSNNANNASTKVTNAAAIQKLTRRDLDAPVRRSAVQEEDGKVEKSGLSTGLSTASPPGLPPGLSPGLSTLLSKNFLLGPADINESPVPFKSNIEASAATHLAVPMSKPNSSQLVVVESSSSGVAGTIQKTKGESKLKSYVTAGTYRTFNVSVIFLFTSISISTFILLIHN